ncbi:hypothetical protein SOVF_089480 [Spinacia oleracea]|nr:hypothetical protein SOVF_089480 [Spinacia oleracea]
MLSFFRCRLASELYMLVCSSALQFKIGLRGALASSASLKCLRPKLTC